ncbi:MAG: Mov34/MPN/PAD-1 family protein [Oscillospiraceae bacterium]|nr:Mov34/MPN/PAD-1 family protein [Oscillospiraceae bacterium]
MGKKRNKQNNNTRSKIPLLNRILKSDRHNEDINRESNGERVISEPALLPSPRSLIYSSELDFIARCIQDFPDIETGGQLYGAWTASGAPRVIYAIGPGPRANHKSTFFNQDVDYLRIIGARLKEYGLQHIGEWHSHHHLNLPHPSEHDAQTMQNGIAQLNLSRLLLCIGGFNKRGIVINPFNFARDSHFVCSQWEIINTRNRLREVIDNDLADLLCSPFSSRYTFSEEYVISQDKPISHQSGWFSVIENRQAFKQIIDYLKSQKWVNDVTAHISSGGIVTLKIITRTFIETLTFPTDFPNSPFEIERMGLIEGTCTYYSFEESWVLAPDIQKTFAENYNLHLRKHQ